MGAYQIMWYDMTHQKPKILEDFAERRWVRSSANASLSSRLRAILLREAPTIDGFSSAGADRATKKERRTPAKRVLAARGMFMSSFRRARA